MSKSKEFNGHKNWNHWNVALWLNNEDELYRMLIRYSRYSDGAQRMMNELGQGARTPDGAPYSMSSIKAAMRDL